MAAHSDNNNFAKKISLEEYNNQKREYTEKALLELKSQMASYKPNKDDRVNSQYESEDEDSYECGSSGETSASVNVIIKNYQDAAAAKLENTMTGLKRRKIPAKSKTNEEYLSTLSNTIYAQRELDLQELQKLKNQLKSLANTLAEEERKNHFLKLDLCNAQVDVSDLKQVLHTRDYRIKQLETKDTETWRQIIKLKMFIGFMLIIYIYTTFYC